LEGLRKRELRESIGGEKNDPTEGGGKGLQITSSGDRGEVITTECGRSK